MTLSFVRWLCLKLLEKNILLYFRDCFQSKLTPKLVEAYHEIKAKDDAFEVIFIPRFSDPYSSEEQSTFDEFCSCVPWLALPRLAITCGIYASIAGSKLVDGVRKPYLLAPLDEHTKNMML